MNQVAMLFSDLGYKHDGESVFSYSRQNPLGQIQFRNHAELEVLARIAARLAGRDADEHVQIKLGGDIVFEDVMWRYPDFLQRAQAAYEILAGPTAPLIKISTRT